ncbi:MAG: hypothetical protein ABI977_33755 [Acidobacteriota bacterium]
MNPLKKLLMKKLLPQHTGIAWYKREQWKRLREVSSDAADIEEQYEDWRQLAEEKIAELQAMCIQVEKVEVDVNEMLAWCAVHGQPLNAESRASFVTKKLEERERETR